MSSKSNEKKALAQVSVDNVPTFTCIIYVRKVDGGVSGRVANLDIPPAHGADERSVLQEIVAAFKKSIADQVAENKDIAWLDPVHDIEAGEQRRLIPVHL